ncbi:TetR/AcrR family transcriptional regulator [Micromonospora peucetia]|uniref:TetR/AcrR family transcriptional regulator n=1 Tax=Micromonospora peucetia TaxID=47871 RepID=A0A1C6VW83_9ACTN|nr:TetR/AcrR family transcriptional regulator [Micromonospora peucetia]MCX4387975.1 TetR/AcrR family transcriptional regulator [Micromonospora peucetia]WSA31334.1 TetR/AcrR family transcriptional regulator [Micromonospora peucetia]SCL70482.1 transcriptional regulator, TetR family [Micromonospora peucetia]
MARTKDPAVRTLLVERAAHMLRTREPITLRSLVAGTGVSTMAVYTHFGGMDGMWKALRQEGFTRLGARLTTVTTSDDPVRDLTALVAGYLHNALDHPDLYRVMFDANFDLEDAQAADDTLEHLVQAAARGRKAGRFRADTVPLELATQSWVIGHGLVSLVATGPLPRQTLDYGTVLLTALFTSSGDQPDACRQSVEDGWQQLLPADG